MDLFCVQADYTVKLARRLAAGWAEIPWSLIRANVKTFPTAPFVPLKEKILLMGGLLFFPPWILIYLALLGN